MLTSFKDIQMTFSQFLRSSKDHVQPFLNFVNDINVNVKFTVEYDNDIFPILNPEVHFNVIILIQLLKRKPTHTVKC